MLDPRMIEQIALVLIGLNLPGIVLRDSHLEVTNAIVIAQPKILAAPVLVCVRQNRIEEEDNAIAREPREITLAGLRRHQAPIWSRFARSRIAKSLVRMDIGLEDSLKCF